MAITDLTGTSWLFPLTPTFEQEQPFHGANINFTTNNESYGYLDVGDEQNAYIYYGAVDAYTEAQGWSDPAYRKIIITGGTDATDSYVINYFVANATDITPNLQLKDKTGTPQTYAVTAGKVNIPNTAGGTTKFSLPSADQLEILANGVFDVSQYGSAKVDVPTGGATPISTPIQVSVVDSLLSAITEVQPSAGYTVYLTFSGGLTDISYSVDNGETYTARSSDSIELTDVTQIKFKFEANGNHEVIEMTSTELAIDYYQDVNVAGSPYYTDNYTVSQNASIAINNYED